MFSTLLTAHSVLKATFNSLLANAFDLDMSNILLFGKKSTHMTLYIQDHAASFLQTDLDPP